MVAKFLPDLVDILLCRPVLMLTVAAPALERGVSLT
jgi:hypothetical protein